MENDNNVKEIKFEYMLNDLNMFTIHDLRVVLTKLGGTPSGKDRSTLVKEIMDIQEGKANPKRDPRGRKPKFIKAEEEEREKIETLDRAAKIASTMGLQFVNDGDRVGYYRVDGNDELVAVSNPPESGKHSRAAKERDDNAVGCVKTISTGTHVCDCEPGELAVDTVIARGILEILPDGYGFIRSYNLKDRNPDFYVERQLLKKYGLKNGDRIDGYAAKKFDKSSLSVCEVLKINGVCTEDFKRGSCFESLTAVYPDQMFITETGSNEYALRSIDLLAPIGKGQRGLIVAPPKTGKTTLLKKLAKSIETNYPEAHLIVLLIDERPEEVTDFADCVIRSEIVASTFDQSPERHIKFAEIYLERAKRLVECGEDVVVLMDSITKLARAYNNALPNSGKILSGGIDPQALVMAKKFFGAARNIRGGGSLTVISTALVETGSRMDDVIFEEFKGTGNMEIVLSRQLSERRIFPAIDISKSGTRNQELLLDKERLEGADKLRRLLVSKDNGGEIFVEMLQKSANNRELLKKLDGWIKLLG